MPFNGSGVFSRVYNWVTDRNNGINILASRVDTEDDGFASGLTLCITKDGQSTPTADIGFGGFKVKNIGSATLASDAVNAGQIQGNLLTYYADTGAADVYVFTTSPTVTSYVAGQSWLVKIANTNLTTTPTINMNGVGAKTIKQNDGTSVPPIGSLVAGGTYTFTYDGTNMQVPITSAITDATISITDVTTNNVSSTKHGWAPKSGADATTFLNGAATPAYAAIKDSDLALTDIATNNVSTSKHGFAPKGDGTTTKFLNANGAYSTPVGISGDIQTFNSSGTWTKPSTGTFAYIQCWGGGGGGGSNKSTSGIVGGGGGGSYKERWVAIASLGGTETVTVGAGGTGANAASAGTANGVNGGNTSFGSWATANGGTGGGGTLNGGAGGGWAATATAATATNDTLGQGTGGAGADGGISYFGGGGGATTTFTGGKSIYGGGGGGGGGTSAGGTSQFGGGGGAGINGGTGTAGTAPGGGGGGAGTNNTTNTAGAGAAGRVIVSVF